MNSPRYFVCVVLGLALAACGGSENPPTEPNGSAHSGQTGDSDAAAQPAATTAPAPPPPSGGGGW
jgi:hypothetical protein